MNIQSVAKLSHCCTPDTDQVLQNCHTVVDGTHCCRIVTLLRIGNGGTIVFTMWHIGKILESACACTYNVYSVYVHGISFCYI